MGKIWGWVPFAAVLACPSAGFAQLSGNCITIGDECLQQEQCGDGQFCSQGACVTFGAECSATADCGGGLDTLCVAVYGQCTVDEECTQGGFCGELGSCLVELKGDPGGDPGGVPGGGDLVPCKDASACSNGDVCTPKGFCGPLPPPCTTNLDCKREGDICDVQLGHCAPADAVGVPCGDDPECAQNNMQPGDEPMSCPEGMRCPSDVPSGESPDGSAPTDTSEADDAAEQAAQERAEQEQAAKDELERQQTQIPTICSVHGAGAGRDSLAGLWMVSGLAAIVIRRRRGAQHTR